MDLFSKNLEIVRSYNENACVYPTFACSNSGDFVDFK